MKRLVCVSNRISLPRRGAAAGGLAVGVLAALGHTGGVWFGWSGETVEQPADEPEVLARGNIRFATVDLRPSEYESYYNGYSNGTLWPIFHYFPGRFRHEEGQREAYHAVNRRFAHQLATLLEPGDVVWVHDYHLIPLGRFLRQEGFDGPVGFFLHIPFPHVQVLRVLPHYAELVRDLCAYDLVGFQTHDDVQSFISCLEPGTPQHQRGAATTIEVGRRDVRLGAYPIGIDVDQVMHEAAAAAREEPVQRLDASLLGRRLVIGVDRLDYSKGLAERFSAYEHFLDTHKDAQGNVTLLQVAPLSRADVLEYGAIRRSLEQHAGRLNGRFAHADWTPLRYLNRNFSHATLMGFLRRADVGLVTPVRDGMNLVAKEFVAAQDEDDPGVLVLSPMAGAAGELAGALLANPYDRRGMALALQTALHMPLDERRRRHQQNLEAVRRHDIHDWYRSFLGDLTGERLPAWTPPPRPEARSRPGTGGATDAAGAAISSPAPRGAR